VELYIVILGTALDAAGQAAVNNEIGTMLGGGATATTKNIEQTTAARKMTAQASALRLTETVRAPSATYTNVNAVVARLQAAVKTNNGRLGGQQVVSISAVPSGSGADAATRSAPALLALLAALLVAVMSAMAQF
jgi:galactokinase/mevalonate kinase-like predicted kinase